MYLLGRITYFGISYHVEVREPPSNQLDFWGTLGSDRIPNLLKLAKVPRKSVNIWIFFWRLPEPTEENRVPRTTLLYFIVHN